MKKYFYSLATGIFLFLIVANTALATTRNVPGFSSTIQPAIDASSNGDIVIVAAGTYNENVIVNKAITLQGAGATTIITPASGIGVVVSVNGVTLTNFKVTGASYHGIYAGSAVSNLTMTNVTSHANGSGTTGSGVALQGVTGTSVLTNITATNNKSHGLEIGNGSAGVQVVGGTFTNNGVAGQTTTGGGIAIYADAGKSTTGTIISGGSGIGGLTASNNTTAGIYITCTPTGTLSGTRIGMNASNVNIGDSVVVNDNGSVGITYNGGAGVIIYGGCSDTRIRANSTRSNSLSYNTAGLIMLGTDNTGANSPTGTIAKDCNLYNFGGSSPAATMSVIGGSTLICTTDVDATVGNSIDGNSLSGFTAEDLLMHKVDNISLGMFRGPGTELFVTTNSGSINRAVAIAKNFPAYGVTKINVKAGSYNENVVVDKASLTIAGQSASTTFVNPSSGSGVAVAASTASVSIQDLNITTRTAGKGIIDNGNSVTALNNKFVYKILAKVFLQGPFSAGTMTTTLNTSTLIPLSQPYTGSPFSYAGGENVASIPANVVDWILVELRTGTASGTLVSRRAVFLKNDGQVLGTDGNAGFNDTLSIASGYGLTNYIVVKHRNHLAVMSAAAVALPNASAYDFTTAQTQAYDDTNLPMKDLLGDATVFGMWMGDANADGVVKYNLANNDKLLIYNRIGNAGYNVTASGYYPEDLNMDGVVKYNLANNDKLFIYNVIGNAGYNVTRVTRVP